MLSCLCFSRRSAHAAAAKVLIGRAFFGSLTPDVAGRLAAALAAKRTTKAPAAVQAMETLLSHSGMETNLENIPMAPPLHLATTYTRPADGIYREGYAASVLDVVPSFGFQKIISERTTIV